MQLYNCTILPTVYYSQLYSNPHCAVLTTVQYLPLPCTTVHYSYPVLNSHQLRSAAASASSEEEGNKQPLCTAMGMFCVLTRPMAHGGPLPASRKISDLPANKNVFTFQLAGRFLSFKSTRRFLTIQPARRFASKEIDAIPVSRKILIWEINPRKDSSH